MVKAEAELGHEGRILLRSSGTEPIVRVMVEARQEAQADAVAAQLCRRGGGDTGATVGRGPRGAPVAWSLMCGIIGVTGEAEPSPSSSTGSSNSNTAGYDSAGIAMVADGGVWRSRAAGGTARSPRWPS